MSDHIPTFNEWCNSSNPNEYSKGLQQISPSILEFWTQECNAIKGIANDISHIHFPSDLANMTLDAVIKIIEGMLSPEGLAMLGTMMGLNLVLSKIFDNIVKDGIAKWFSQSLIDNGILMVENGIVDMASANSSIILTGVIRYGLTEIAAGTIVEGLIRGGVYAISILLKAFSYILEELIPYLGDIALVVQLVGMIFDEWDPCHFNDELSASTINQMNISFDNAFRKTMLSALNSTTDSYGNIFFIDIWPIEIYADNAFLAQETTGQDIYGNTIDYDNLQSLLTAYYLNNMIFNSKGEPICIPVNPGSNINSNTFSKLDNILSNNNNIVGNWIKKLWPIILVVIIIIIIILIIFIYK